MSNHTPMEVRTWPQPSPDDESITPLPIGLDQPSLAEVAAVLSQVETVVQMVNSGLLLHEASSGLRILEPRNDLCQTLRELHWCIARLNGLTDQPRPQGDRLT